MSLPASSSAGGPSDDSKTRRKAMACAECRRLKLKCDKKVPCSSCSKRGCGAVCPNGTLAAGPGNRFVLADTKQLHEQIEDMSKKIAELEDTLAELHGGVSSEPHPLLAQEYMLIKALPSSEKVNEATKRPLHSMLGTLAIGDSPHFYGPHAASDLLLTLNDTEDDSFDRGTLPRELAALSRSFPLSNLADLKDEIWPRLRDAMPRASVARHCIDVYYRNGTWLYDVIPRDELEDTVVSLVYPGLGEDPSIDDVPPHGLGMLLLVIAVGHALDINREAYALEGVDAYQLARIALSVDSVLDHPTMNACRATFLMTWYLGFCDQPAAITMAYNLLGLTAQLCHSLGLHRDDTPWDLEDAEKQRRRTLLWDVVSYDAFVSLSLGRPPAFSTLHLDAKMAEDRQGFTDAQGERHPSLRGWMHKFANDCLLKVQDQAFGVVPLTYNTVQRLDKLIRDIVPPPHLKIAEVGKYDPEADANPLLLLERTTAFVVMQRTLLYLHRGFFAQAIVDSPEDPLRTVYAQSVLAAFRSSFYITASVRVLLHQVPLASRFSMFITDTFSAMVILGTVVMKSPGSGLAPSAWAELERIYEIFNRLQTVSRSVKRLHPKLEKLYGAAQTSYRAFTSSQGQSASHRPHDVAEVEAQVDEMEFKYITGHTRLIETASTLQNQHVGRSQQQKAPTAPHQAQQPQRVQAQTIQLEPTVSQPVQAQPPPAPQHHQPIVQRAVQQPLVAPLPSLAQQQQQINVEPASVSSSIGWGQPITGYEPSNLVAPAAAYQQQQAPPSAIPVQYQHQSLDPTGYGVQSVPIQHQPQQAALPMYDPAYDTFFPPLPNFESVPQTQAGFQQQQPQGQQYVSAQPGQAYNSGTWEGMQYMGDPAYGVDGTQQGQQGHNLNAMWQQFMDGIGMYDGMGINPQQGANNAA